jgi:hypothetical protein
MNYQKDEIPKIEILERSTNNFKLTKQDTKIDVCFKYLIKSVFYFNIETISIHLVKSISFRSRK